MSLPLPPEFWPLQPDDVAVVIEGSSQKTEFKAR